MAAFVSGQLLDRLHQPLAAAESFRRARELAPTGSLAEDALAREVEACSKAGRSTDALRSARLYMERYPGGRWLHAVQLHAGVPAR